MEYDTPYRAARTAEKAAAAPVVAVDDKIIKTGSLPRWKHDQWKLDLRARMRKAGVTSQRLGSMTGHSANTVGAYLSESGRLNADFIRKAESAMREMEAMKLPPLVRWKGKAAPGWGEDVRVRAARVGLSIEVLAWRAGYEVSTLRSALAKAGWNRTQTMIARIEGVLSHAEGKAA